MSVPQGSDQSTATDRPSGPPPKARRVLRKSCHFCRSRKIKCSGDTICDACRERNMECSYKEGEPKGRPKSTSKPMPTAAARKLPSAIEQPIGLWDDTSGAGDFTVDELPSTYPHFSTLSAVATGSQEESTNPLRQPPEAMFIGTRLSNAFSRLNGSAQGPQTEPAELKMTSFKEHMSRHGSRISKKCTSSPINSDLSYEDVFFIIAQELMELLALRLGEIGCSQLDHTRSHYFLKAYMADTSNTMFDEPSPTSARNTPLLGSGPTQSTGHAGARYQNPLQDYDSHQMAQMTEIWFSQHPFSSMLSKTLLLRDIRQGTFDDVLIAAMLGDVEATLGTQSSSSRGHALYTLAGARLNAISESEVRLSTIQAIVLLGWHALCVGQARRALTLLVWADTNIRAVPILKPGVNIVNGIDVGEIEAELLCITHWLTFSINHWIMMQTQITARDIPLLDVPTVLPSSDTTSLATLRLDQASYSISTLQSQESSYRELWLLSYVAAFTSQIYRLCPRVSSPLEEAATESQGWQSHVLNRLRALSNPMDDILVICTQVRHVLTDLVQNLDNQDHCTTAQALEISVAHTILVHLLLPSPAEISGINSSTSSNMSDLGARRVLAAGGIQKLISEFCCSVKALLKVFTVLKNSNMSSPRTSRITMSKRASTTDYIIFLALDACVRGLKSLWSLSRTGTDAEKQYLNEKREELQSLASELHLSSKKLERVDAARLGLVIEQLEIVICHFLGVEVEEYESVGATYSYASGSTSIRSRTPPSENTDTSMLIMDNTLDLTDPSNMDFMAKDMWSGLITMPSLTSTHDWSIG